MISGRSAALSFSENGCLPLTTSSMVFAERPTDSTGYVRSPCGPMDATCVPPATLARRRRALSTGASIRGSVPTRRTRSSILHADDVAVEEVRRARVGADALNTLGDGVTRADAVEEILQRDDGLRVAQLSSHRLHRRGIRRRHLVRHRLEGLFLRVRIESGRRGTVAARVSRAPSSVGAARRGERSDERRQGREKNRVGSPSALRATRRIGEL